MYCSLEDAWGGNNLTSSQNNILTSNLDPYSFGTNETYQSIEKPQDIPENVQPVEPVIENYENHSSDDKCMEKLDCHDIVDKILACPTCKSILMKKLNNSNETDSIFNLSFLNNNTEMIILLITIVILIIIIDFIVQAIKK